MIIDSAFVIKFLKFCLVGGSGVVVDFGVTYLAKEIAHLNKYLANSLGFLVAASSNFLINRAWTFHSSAPDISMQYLKFMVISLVGLLLSNGVIYLLTERYKRNFYLSKLFAIGMVTLWNFFMNALFTFC